MVRGVCAVGVAWCAVPALRNRPTNIQHPTLCTFYGVWVQKNAGSPSTLSRRAAAVSSEELKEQ